jgi:hypothetical protein
MGLYPYPSMTHDVSRVGLDTVTILPRRVRVVPK